MLEQPTANDEIDIREYLYLLASWWREIILISFLFFTLAFAAIFMWRQVTPEVYSASATVAIARVVSNVTFDARFQTSSDNDSVILQSNASSRRAALLGLVTTGAVIDDVLLETSSVLDVEEQVPAILLSMIKANIVTGQNERIESDLIRIVAQANTPEKATAIANSWASNYVQHINGLYGQVPAEVVGSVDAELDAAEANYASSQRNLESFISTNQVRALQRQIDEKQGIIDSLQLGKQTAIDTIVEEELNARRQIISAYINALANNRLLGFQKEQQSKLDLINAYIDAEATNRLAAVEEDRRIRETLFRESADAQIAAAASVIQERANGRIDLLRQNYRIQLELRKVLVSAQILQAQMRTAGDDSAATSGGVLLLLKAQMASIPTVSRPSKSQVEIVSADNVDDEQQPQNVLPVVNNFAGLDNASQFTIDIGQPIIDDASALLADVSAFINAVEEQLETIETQIVELSTSLVDGDGYESDALSVDVLGISADNDNPTESESEHSVSESSLGSTLVERYFDLFGVGRLAEIENSNAVQSEVLQQVEALYPGLFTLDHLSALTDSVPDDTPLAIVSLEKAQELLQLQGLEDIPEYTASAEPLIQAVDKLDSEIQLLQAQLEAERSQEQQLVQQRDLAWEAYTTLSNKSAELKLAQSATNSEVRLAAPAVSPIEPIPGINPLLSAMVAGVVGLLLGILVAFFSYFMGYQPFLRRGQPSAA